MTPIVDILPRDFQPRCRFRMVYGARGDQVENFVTTQIGRTVYAVSEEHGYAYTRKQLIAKYGRISAQFSTLVDF